MSGRYYEERGADAWREEEIPHFITDNAAIAHSYAQVVFAFWRDRLRLSVGSIVSEPLHICELGAGSGRFAFHFLHALGTLCLRAGVPRESFRYVLTDQAASNVAAWREHPTLQPFFADGTLAAARFDIRSSDALILEVGYPSVRAGDLRHPIVVIANYVFDSVPQELFYVDGDTQERCLISLAVADDPERLSEQELVEQIQWRYARAPFDPESSPDALLADLAHSYRGALEDTYLTLPIPALRCLERLAALSPSGLLLLSADKGSHVLGDLEGQPAPEPIRHGGCVSMNVNYHALATYAERRGGIALFPAAAGNSIDVGCLLLVDDPAAHWETALAFQSHVADFGPDDFFEISQLGWTSAKKLPLETILSLLRLSRYDSQMLATFLPRLQQLAPKVDALWVEALGDVLDRVWAGYFPLREPLDLPFEMGLVLCYAGQYGSALEYFRRSVEIYGPHEKTEHNIALCRRMLDDDVADVAAASTSA